VRSRRGLARRPASSTGQRPTGASRWANLWSSRTAKLADGESPEQAAARLTRELTGFHADMGAKC